MALAKHQLPTVIALVCTAIVVIGGLIVALVVSSVPDAVDTNEDGAAKITAGGSHTCAIANDGDVYCWGNNNRGQLGNTTDNAAANPTALPVTLPSEAAAIAGSFDHTCAVLTDGDVYCWGNNWYGQLGNTINNATTTGNPTPLPVTLPSEATAITAGIGHTCVLLRDATVYCWGYNRYGQLGNTTNTTDYQINTTNPTPLPVTLPSEAAAIAAGNSHTCAVLTDGDVYCWGLNSRGQLRNTTNITSYNSNPIPLPVTLASEATAITAEDYHTCALFTNGDVSCWGWNYYGQLGNTTNYQINTTNPAPLPVTLPSAAIAITAGISHTCAVLTDGDVYCWGLNSSGQLGNTTKSFDGDPTPLPVTLPSEATAITAGGDHTCAILTDSDVYCWGNNNHGELGNTTNNGTGTANPTPMLATIPG
jgi:alpha-tubulin suppressor-like RCC1 family protein